LLVNVLTNAGNKRARRRLKPNQLRSVWALLGKCRIGLKTTNEDGNDDAEMAHLGLSPSGSP
jgi:hypothetical protein